MNVAERCVLRNLAKYGQAAESSPSPRSLLSLCGKDYHTARFAELICEASPDTRLLPPYGSLVRSVVSPDGELTVVSVRGGFELMAPDRLNLIFVSDYFASFSAQARAAISANVLERLARGNDGSDGEGAGAEASPAARTVEEVAALPAVKVLLRVLDEHSADVKAGDVASQSSQKLKRVLSLAKGSAERDQFMREAGLHILRWVRHAFSHISNCDAVLRLRKAGISGPFVVGLVRASVAAVVDTQVDAFVINSAGVLERATSAGGRKRPEPAPTTSLR
jgi:hypothetical protein